MDKYLLSSPTLLSQPFEVQTVDVFDDQNRTSSAHQESMFSRENDYDNEVVPVSSNSRNSKLYLEDFQRRMNNLNESIENENMNHNSNNISHNNHSNNNNSSNNMNDFDSTVVLDSGRFSHSKNISLDEGTYNMLHNHLNNDELDEIDTDNDLDNEDSNNNQKFHNNNFGIHNDDVENSNIHGVGSVFGSRRPFHQNTLLTSSIASMSQDPPSSQYVSTLAMAYSMPQSYSNNTLYSMESIPQLSLSASNQSLSDSPSSLQQHALLLNQKLNVAANFQPVMATPRRAGRNKSLSISSINNASANIFNTPLRSHTSSALSPVALTKVSKTPHSSKVKGHTRSRSRMSIDALNLPLSLAGVVAGKSAGSSSFSAGANANLNPFYSLSTFVSPRVSKSGDLDDFGTPLQTPGQRTSIHSNRANLASDSGTSNMSSSFFSPSNNSNSNSNSSGSNMPYVLKRHDTLDSIKIEDQEDDAIKQLKKAKSYSSIANAILAASRTTAKDSAIKRDDSFINAADLSLRLITSQIGSNATITESNENPEAISSSSTPGIFYTDTSLLQYGQNLSLADATKSYSVPNSASEYDDTYIEASHFSVTPAYRPKGVDLLLLLFTTDLNNPLDSSMAKFNKNLVKNLSQSVSTTSFTKSYPASIDLASIATAPLSRLQDASNKDLSNTSMSSQSTPPVYPGGIVTGSQPGLLPPMAAFPVLQEMYVMNGGIPLHHNGLSMVNPAPLQLDDKVEKEKAKKKHKCPMCDARFQRPEHVKRHMKSHSSEKPFECDEPECGKRFNRKDNLKAHLKKIHGRQL